MMGTIHLVSCAARKQPVPAPAKCLYTSALFRKARSHVVGTSLPWFILSAEYGLVRPDEVIAPYDRTLNTMSVADRRRWARRVLMQLESHLEGVTEVVFLAGLRYREFPHTIVAPSWLARLRAYARLSNRRTVALAVWPCVNHEIRDSAGFQDMHLGGKVVISFTS